MENAERSKRTREAVIQAALTILRRDGPSRLTLDAIVRESGISKGGLMHQFRTKQEVVKALVSHQIETSKAYFDNKIQDLSDETEHRYLLAQLLAVKRVEDDGPELVSTLLAAIGEDPDLLKPTVSSQRHHLEGIRTETPEPDLALLRWTAARGLVVTKMLGMCPFTDAEREHLFALISDNDFWRPLEEATPAKSAPRRRKPKQTAND